MRTVTFGQVMRTGIAVLFLVSVSAFGKPAYKPMREVEKASDCIVRGHVIGRSEVRSQTGVLSPERVEIVSIKVSDKKKSTSLFCSGIENRIDVLVSIGPSEGTRIETCSIPDVAKSERLFYVDFSRGVAVPADCYQWVN